MGFTTSDIKQLREKTGCGMMDCKKALSETNGDMSAAVDFLRKKGLASASKKSGRIAAEGLAIAKTFENNRIGVAIEVNSETDFVAKNSDFQDFVDLCADTVCKASPANVESLLETKVPEKNQTIGEILQEKIFVIGENIKIRRFKRLEGMVFSYIHANGKIAVLVNFQVDREFINSGEFQQFAKDITLQIAASSPQYVKIDDVPKEEVEHEKKILTEQIVNEGKSQNVVDRIISGRINKYYKDVCLLEQVFVKDTSLSVKEFTKEIEKKLGTTIGISEFVRFEMGHGIEKKTSDLQSEVANIVKNFS